MNECFHQSHRPYHQQQMLHMWATISPHIYLDQSPYHAVLKLSILCCCFFKSQGLSYLLVCSYCPTQCLVCSRKHDAKLFGFISQLCQFIVAAGEYLLCVRHLLGMLLASVEFIPPCMVEQKGSWSSPGLKELAKGHHWWMGMPGFLPKPPGQVQGSRFNMAPGYTVSCAFISPPPVGQVTCRSSKINPIIWYSLMSSSLPSCSVLPINSTLVPQPHSGSVSLLNESSQWH